MPAPKLNSGCSTRSPSGVSSWTSSGPPSCWDGPKTSTRSGPKPDFRTGSRALLRGHRRRGVSACRLAGSDRRRGGGALCDRDHNGLAHNLPVARARDNSAAASTRRSDSGAPAYPADHELSHRLRQHDGRRAARRGLRDPGRPAPAPADRRLRHPAGHRLGPRAAREGRGVRGGHEDVRPALQDPEPGRGVRGGPPDRVAALRRPPLALRARAGRGRHAGDRVLRLLALQPAVVDAHRGRRLPRARNRRGIEETLVRLRAAAEEDAARSATAPERRQATARRAVGTAAPRQPRCPRPGGPRPPCTAGRRRPGRRAPS